MFLINTSLRYFCLDRFVLLKKVKLKKKKLVRREIRFVRHFSVTAGHRVRHAKNNYIQACNKVLFFTSCIFSTYITLVIILESLEGNLLKIRRNIRGRINENNSDCESLDVVCKANVA